MTFRQTVFTDGDVPANTALSSPILISIKNDSIFEGVEYFQARIVETSDEFRVRIGQDTVNITITDSESCIILILLKRLVRLGCILQGSLAEITNQRFSSKYQMFRQLAAEMSGISKKILWLVSQKRTLSESCMFGMRVNYYISATMVC